MIKGNWFITPHAIKRYRQLCCCKIDDEQALEELIQISITARFVKEQYPGMSIYRTGKPWRHRLVVSTRQPGKPQLVTVLS